MEKPRQFNLSIIFRIILVVFILLLSGFVSIRSFLGKAESKIKSQDGKVNLLILGKGGVGHAGGDLTDTMIFASVSLKDDSVSLVSLPRDIWIPEIRAKINSAYYWGKVKPEDTIYFKNAGEPIIAKAKVSKIKEFENLDSKNVREILEKYGGNDGISIINLESTILWAKEKRYCTLIYLKNPQTVKPFNIDKRGFGTGAAWICVEKINMIKITS